MTRFFIRKEIVESPRDCPFCSIYMTSDGIVRDAICGYNRQITRHCSGAAAGFPPWCQLEKENEWE